MTDTPTTFGEHYELLQHVASGGMADIWLAERVGEAGFRKRVCIKRIKGDHIEDSEYIAMFLDEARIISRLSHPHIVEVYELGRVDDEWFVAMEWIDGRDLDQVIAERRSAGERVAPDVACRILSDLLAGLSHAHGVTDIDGTRLDLVHRDISPSNVLLSTAGIAKLADFGVASAIGRQTKTQTGAVKGKLAYMAPEQIGAKQLDARTDLFAVGIVAYELLTGVHPFGDGLSAVHHIVEKDPPPVEVEIPDALVDVVLRALRKDPADRWPTAEAMRDAVESVIRAEGWHASSKDVSFLATPPGEDTVREPPVEFAVPTLDLPVPTQEHDEVVPTADFPMEEPVPTLDFPLFDPEPTKDFPQLQPEPTKEFPSEDARRAAAKKPGVDNDMLVLGVGLVVFLVLLVVVFGLLAATRDEPAPVADGVADEAVEMGETDEDRVGEVEEALEAERNEPSKAGSRKTDPAAAEVEAERAKREADRLKKVAEDARKEAEKAKKDEEKAAEELREETKKGRGKGKGKQKRKKGKGKDD